MSICDRCKSTISAVSMTDFTEMLHEAERCHELKLPISPKFTELVKAEADMIGITFDEAMRRMGFDLSK